MRTLFVLFILVVTTYAYSQKKQVADKKNSNSLYKLEEQSTEQKELDEFLKMRSQMLKQMHEAFMDDDINPDNLLDKVFEKERKGTFSLGATNGDLYQSHWEENKNERILAIKPMNKNVPLDIKINNQMISIGAKEEKKEHGGGFSSSFMSSTSLPEDVDGNKAQIEQRGEEILVRLPRRGLSGDNKEKKLPSKKVDDGMTPIKPNPEDITI
ncbi:MAG: hypothetical protein ACOYL6_00075 [Bacteriovoracaceae bacterium]